MAGKNYNLDKLSLTELKEYVTELETKLEVYEMVIKHSNFRPIVEDSRRYFEDSKSYKPRNTRKPKQFNDTKNTESKIEE